MLQRIRGDKALIFISLSGPPYCECVLASVDSAALPGLCAFTVLVEVDCEPGMSKYFIVRLPDTTVREAQERKQAHG